MLFININILQSWEKVKRALLIIPLFSKAMLNLQPQTITKLHSQTLQVLLLRQFKKRNYQWKNWWRWSIWRNWNALIRSCMTNFRVTPTNCKSYKISCSIMKHRVRLKWPHKHCRTRLRTYSINLQRCIPCPSSGRTSHLSSHSQLAALSSSKQPPQYHGSPSS